MPIYKRPPVVEAIIDVRVDVKLEKPALEGLERLFLEKYPFSQPSASIGVELSENAATVNQSFAGYTMRSADGAAAIVLNTTSLATTKQAPYPGWESLVSDAKSNWDVWRKEIGKKKIIRVGVRFINRIDIPVNEGKNLDLEEYLNVGARIPDLGLSITNFALHAEANSKLPYSLLINVGSTPSPLVKTASFLVDLDLFAVNDLPQSDDDLWHWIEQFRGYKNSLFESFVTDKARGLFNE